jgi:DNA polymerase-3 subunit delta'
MSETPEADRLDGAPHPRETSALFGQEAAEAAILDAFARRKLHHAWLLTGPRGVGKATLAWRMARTLRAHPPDDGGLLGGSPPPTTLDLDPGHAVARQVLALSEPGIHLVRRGWDAEKKKLRAQILVDDIRALQRFFSMSSFDGGRRVAIVDAADDMNVQAANALLKTLEEPPRNAHLILVSHAPSRLLPTIRSRCRELRLPPLEPDDIARALDLAGTEAGQGTMLAALAQGSVGQAMRLANLGGPDIYGEILACLSRRPLDRGAIAAFAGRFAARGAESRLELAVELLELALSRAAMIGAGATPAVEAAPKEFETLAALAPNPDAARRLAALHQEIGARIAHGLAVNIDPAMLLTDAMLKIDAAAARAA